MSHQKLWESCLQFFKQQLPPQQYNSWIKPLIFETKGSQIILTAPNGFTLKVIQERFLTEITRQICNCFIKAVTAKSLQ